MEKAYIKAISYTLPETIVTNDQLIKKFPEWTVEKVAKKIGVESRHIVQKNETAVTLAEKAAKALFAEWNILASEIDFILLCTQSPDYFIPTSACILQNKLGVPKSAGALDFNLGCSGYVYGLALAKGLVVSGVAKNVLLLTGETYSKYIHPDDKGNRTIFGDAASASVVSCEGFAEICEFELGTDGSGAENLMVKTGASKYPQKKDCVSLDANGANCYSDYLYMNGAEIFSFTQEVVPKLIQSILDRHNFKISDVDLFVFHQANKFILNFLRKRIKVAPEKFYYHIADVGNTVSSSIPIALAEAMKGRVVQSEHKVVIAGFGVGYSWGATILKFSEIDFNID